ncbi:hypothetical protein NUH88_13350 [Nisaea acidiphila]|uniref:Erythromycin biosynthesis protein CIII-like C-terminal domain-containing protein n=1 Tax=Nisaea acidiphila TaxID=1862145 RepID=A0A9J7AMK5_9PROT|nr:nucleotide disphospho-sugar-binding domain-containing protein [Nisaea acidiphila]UUX48399.1 hypothetical protein NUH88_13350 [Nisaea acidiphila]
MKRVLLAWELGDGLGHVSRLLPIASALKEHGVECAFAVRNLIVTHPLIARAGFPVFHAPWVQPYAPPAVRDKPISSIGDVLATVGYSEPDKLMALADGWAAILDTFEPDLVITDYSPTAALAAFGERPFVAIGDWFTLPPGNWTEFRTFKQSPNRVDPSELMDTVREVQKRRGKPVPDRLPALMQGVRNFVVTIPELDPYHEFRENTETSPLRPLPAALSVEPTQDYFVYLSNSYPGTAKVLEVLATKPWTGEIFLRDASDAVRAHWRERGLTVHETPQPMDQVVGRSRIIVHHGGLGTLEQVLAMGRPQFIVPRHFEQMRNGTFAGKRGVATLVRSGNNFQTEHVEKAMGVVFDDPGFAERAREVASELERRGPFNLLARITDYILSTLNQN